MFCLFVYLCTMCMPGVCMVRRGHWVPGTEIRGCESWYKCWESNLGPWMSSRVLELLKEASVLPLRLLLYSQEGCGGNSKMSAAELSLWGLKLATSSKSLLCCWILPKAEHGLLFFSQRIQYHLLNLFSPIRRLENELYSCTEMW